MLYMATPLKEIYDENFLRSFGQKIVDVYPGFDIDCFVRNVMDESWHSLELKQRIRKFAVSLGDGLPDRYEEALDILMVVHERCRGFPYLILPDFVEVFGQADAHWERSMKALALFTQGSSAEFAVRPFLLREPERMMRQMLEWASHPNEHVRRLASEGCRPRLPWGQALPMFKRDPSPILPVLERLKADLSLYVRKSVANNLNDIAKDNPGVVLEVARRWMGMHPHTDWIVRHGLRTLVRKGDPAALALFGYELPAEAANIAVHASIAAAPSEISIGDVCELAYELQIREGSPVKIRIEYGIDFVKSGGRTSRKLFLLSDKTVHGGAHLVGTRMHRWADLSTRRHYPGEHRIVLLVNGQEAAHTTILLSAGDKAD
jgi:3-methyladenine DNA glycosylase AlkC